MCVELGVLCVSSWDIVRFGRSCVRVEEVTSNFGSICCSLGDCDNFRETHFDNSVIRDRLILNPCIRPNESSVLRPSIGTLISSTARSKSLKSSAKAVTSARKSAKSSPSISRSSSKTTWVNHRRSFCVSSFGGRFSVFACDVDTRK